MMQEIDAGIYTISAFLDGNQTAAHIASAEKIGFDAASIRTSEGPKMMSSIRNNDRVELESSEIASALWERLRNFSLPHIDGLRADGVSRMIRYYRYVPGQRFKMHKDGRLQEDGKESRLSFLVYLNDDFEGGETRFRSCTIRPESGLALLFVHETWHEGVALQRGCKYVLRSDVLYCR
jgi:hypothetical protein